MLRPTRRMDGQGAHPGRARREPHDASRWRPSAPRATDTTAVTDLAARPPMSPDLRNLELSGSYPQRRTAAVGRCPRGCVRRRNSAPGGRAERCPQATGGRFGGPPRPTGGHRPRTRGTDLGPGRRHGQRYPIDLHRWRQNRGTAAVPMRGAPGKGAPRRARPCCRLGEPCSPMGSVARGRTPVDGVRTDGGGRRVDGRAPVGSARAEPRRAADGTGWPRRLVAPYGHRAVARRRAVDACHPQRPEAPFPGAARRSVATGVLVPNPWRGSVLSEHPWAQAQVSLHRHGSRRAADATGRRGPPVGTVTARQRPCRLNPYPPPVVAGSLWAPCVDRGGAVPPGGLGRPSTGPER